MAFGTSRSASSPSDAQGTASGTSNGTIQSVALAELHRAHCGKLRRFFARRGARQDADDLVQESFARFAGIQAKNPGRVFDCPEAYLTAIAANLLRDRARVAARRSIALNILAHEVPLIGSDTVAALEARDHLERLQGSLARLSPKSRLVFLAHRRDGLSYKEIAKREGLSEKSVQKRMSKAIAHVARAKAGF